MYVKCFDTVMFYYVILVYSVNVPFSHFYISCRSVPVRPEVAGNGTQKTDAGIGRGHCRRDIMGAKDKVSEEEIPEQRCRVFPSVAWGYCLCYTREYLQGG
ncbi:unnamed protein product [Staurois parvus]|uniref:Uncharacterized protein n=1 Tax=Staurois parvus TaxID=386267 RepID=A0ABN9EED2_9NEOB|nr:unnamed protein product [Staurois parvus]